MTKRRFDIAGVGCIGIGYASYEPGWKWSEHIGPGVGTRRHVELVGMAIAGCATAAFETAA